MASLSIKFMRAILLVEALLVVTRCVRGLETDVSIKDLDFKLNKKFLFNTKACEIPAMEVEFEFPDDVERVLERSLVVDLHNSSKWLRPMSAKIKTENEHILHKVRAEEDVPTPENLQDPIWLRNWRRKFRKKQYDLVSEGKGMSSCIIWNKAERHICCNNYLDKQGATGTLREYKFRFCMRLVKVFVETLLKTGVLLADDDEEKLEDEFGKVLAKMAKKRAGGKVKVSLTPLYEVGIDNIVSDDDTHPLTDEEKARYSKEEQLLQFLVSMKQMEYLFRTKQESYLNTEQKVAYSTFMKAFHHCFKKKKTAVSYHTAEIRWTTCGPVAYGDLVAGYCADLEALDPKARELRRKPILKWESGAYEYLHDLLDPENIDNISDRTSLERRRQRKLRSAVRAEKYRNVDLLQAQLLRTDSSCDGVDLANACHAMCCDSGFKMSYYCESQGLRCIG